MFQEMCLYLMLLLALISQSWYVLADEPATDSVGTFTTNQYSAHLQSESVAVPVPTNQQQHLQPQSQHLNHHSQQQTQSISVHQKVGSSSNNNNIPIQGGSHSIYHAAPGSGHMEKRNSYNLLSEAMSQAVSNEFSALGSGSADGACQADDLDCYSGNVQDRLGMEAIRTLHRQLDDDDNGNIDLSESDDFLREELKYDSGYEKRQKVFHFNDDMHISVKELWEAWLRSEVHNWTIEQTTDWLAQSVQLPQYVELFKLHKVTGATLPRLAVNNMHYVSNVLGIKDPIHKQKISLKAMDVVLFGPPRETGTRWKDYILVTLLLSAIIGCWYAYQQNKNAKRHLRRMAQDMEGLQRAEQSLLEMQKELERARMEQENVATEKMDLERRLKEAPSLSSSSSDLEVQQLKKEIEMLRTELSRAEFELVDNCWAPPPQLQSWLQYTYELESKNHLKKRISAEKQLQSAREACEKLRKKRSSLVGAFVSTHGKSIDDVDRSIVEARNALGEVTHELQERLHRWKQIETCLGINIVNNNGLSYLESVLYGRNGGTIKGSRGRITSSSTDDLDDESVQAKCCDPKVQTWFQWKSTLHTSPDLNKSNQHTQQNQVEYPDNNFLTQTSQQETLDPSTVVTTTRKWLNNTVAQANNLPPPPHRPSNLHPPPSNTSTSLKDVIPQQTSGRRKSESTNISICCNNMLTSANNSLNSVKPKSHFCHPISLQQKHLSLVQQLQQPTSRETHQICNLAARQSFVACPPPPHLRQLVRRHTVIPKWKTHSNTPLKVQVSTAALKNENEDCVSLSPELKKHTPKVAALKINLHNSHSANCLLAAESLGVVSDSESCCSSESSITNLFYAFARSKRKKNKKTQHEESL